LKGFQAKFLEEAKKYGVIPIDHCLKGSKKFDRRPDAPISW
jgi:hypothetical protein